MSTPPHQPIPITLDNFYIRTTGVFTEIKDIPKDYIGFFNSKESAYYHSPDKTKVVRVSNHWGWGIRYCAWFLKGIDKMSARKWTKVFGKGMRVGEIYINQFKVNHILNWGKRLRNDINSRQPDIFKPVTRKVLKQNDYKQNFTPEEKWSAVEQLFVPKPMTTEQKEFLTLIFGADMMPKNLKEHLEIHKNHS